MHFTDDIASNNCEQDVTISHDMGQYDTENLSTSEIQTLFQLTENLSTSEIQKLKKRLETELAYRLLKTPTIPIDASFDSLPDDDFSPFDDDDFEADNDNREFDYDDELDRGFEVCIDHEYPGQVAAERNCFRFTTVMQELCDCEIRRVWQQYDLDGNPVAVVKYWHGGEKEAHIVFKVNRGLEDKDISVFARAI